MSTDHNTLLFSLSAITFSLHIAGYIIYAYYTLNERIKPNAASWLMWLFGGVIEYVTYESIDSGTIFSSSLPIACIIGVIMIFIATAITQLRSMWRKESHHVFHNPSATDYGLISFDAFAGMIWYVFNAPVLANSLAVGSSIVTFIPIWKTTLETGEERWWPWLLWCFAYTSMAITVVLEGGHSVLEQLVYPVYYLILHAVVLLLCFKSIRKVVTGFLVTRVHE